ncbi:MAG: Lnb N-terminal periplasmic domain-containing protein, partial [Nitrospiraceae bacterium]
VDRPYLDELIGQSRRLTLADEREWRLLLHYRANLFGGYTSEQDDPGFFLSSDGKTNPQAELEATLAQLFSEELVGRSQQPAQCAFVARYGWLKEKLAFDDTRLKPLACERFERWLNEFNAQSVTLIFPAAFMNNPASMFGHTFLRIDQKGQTNQTRILAYTINFAADVPPNAGLAYPIRGIFGGYRGYYSTIPYYLKVQEYRDIENRDIWEYRLNFTEEQVQRLLRHAWELGNSYFDYFFLKENCSYHLLSLLEYADPALHLTDQFLFWTVPADTVRLIAAQPGLVGDIAYRPSRSNVIRRKRETLSRQEAQRFKDIVRDASGMKSEEFLRLAPNRQAFVLDLASDYLRYQGEGEEGDTYKERNQAVLTARSGLRVPPEEAPIIPFAKQPELGHKTSRVSVGGGWRNNDTFEEVTVRAGYHDLLDPEIGYTPDAQIELAGLSLRHYNRMDQTRVERATLANIVSLSPMDSLFHAPSWKINVGMQTIRHRDCRLCSNGNLNAGIGAAAETRWLRREVYFVFAEAEANYSRAYEERHRVGGGGTMGVLADITDRWKMMVSGTYLRYALGEKSDDVRWFVGQRYTVARNWALRLEYNHRDHDNDVLFTIQAFF